MRPSVNQVLRARLIGVLLIGMTADQGTFAALQTVVDVRVWEIVQEGHDGGPLGILSRVVNHHFEGFAFSRFAAAAVHLAGLVAGVIVIWRPRWLASRMPHGSGT